MANQDFATSFTVDQTPEEAFQAINDVRGWWSEGIAGADVCSNAWGSYINGSLRSLITTGAGRPNRKES